MTEETCSHLDAITQVKRPTRRECEECVKIGASWVHLRTCQTCGVTLCCDDSPNRHATKHAHAEWTSGDCFGRTGRAMVVLLSRRCVCGVLDFDDLRSH